MNTSVMVTLLPTTAGATAYDAPVPTGVPSAAQTKVEVPVTGQSPGVAVRVEPTRTVPWTPGPGGRRRRQAGAHRRDVATLVAPSS